MEITEEVDDFGGTGPETPTPGENNASFDSYADESFQEEVYVDDKADEGGVNGDSSFVGYYEAKYPAIPQQGSVMSIGVGNVDTNGGGGGYESQMHLESNSQVESFAQYHSDYKGTSIEFGGSSSSAPFYPAFRTCLPHTCTNFVTTAAPTMCDVLCTTNTTIKYGVAPVEHKMKDTVGILPFKGRRIQRVTQLVKGETPWQKHKMTEAHASRNVSLKDERDEYMAHLEEEKFEKNWIDFLCATRIQAIWRGMLSRDKLDKRRSRPLIYKRRRKPVYKVVQSQMQDELCELAHKLDLKPIPGLCLVSRGKASKRMKKIQSAAAFRMQIFFQLIVAREKARRVLMEKRHERIFKAARTVARFFKSLKMRTFSYRCRVEKQTKAVAIIQNSCRAYLSRHRVRVLRRRVVRYRRETNASIILQRNFKKIFSNYKTLSWQDAVLNVKKKAGSDAIEEEEEKKMTENVINTVTDLLIEEEISVIVTREEEAKIALELQKLAEMTAKMESDRITLEKEMAQRVEEEELAAVAAVAEKEAEKEQLLKEAEDERQIKIAEVAASEVEEERKRIEALTKRREQEEKRKAEENARAQRLEEEARLAIELAKNTANEAVKVSIAAISESTLFTDSSMKDAYETANMAETNSLKSLQNHSFEEQRELATFKKTIDLEKEMPVTQTQNSETSTTVNLESENKLLESPIKLVRDRNFKSEPEISEFETFASEMSQFYLSSAIENARPSTPIISKAREAVADVLSAAKLAVTSEEHDHDDNTQGQDNLSVSVIAPSVAKDMIQQIMETSKSNIVIEKSSRFYEVYGMLTSARTLQDVSNLNFTGSLQLLENVEAEIEKIDDASDSTESDKSVSKLLLSEVMVYKGNNFEGLCEYEQACSYFNKSIALKKDLLFGASDSNDYSACLFDAYLKTGICTFQQGKMKEAIEKFKTLLNDQDADAQITQKLSDQFAGVTILRAFINEATSPYANFHNKILSLAELAKCYQFCGMYNEATTTKEEAKLIFNTDVLKENDSTKMKIKFLVLDANKLSAALHGTSDALECLYNLINMERSFYESSNMTQEEHDKHPALVDTMLMISAVLTFNSSFDKAEYFVDRSLEVRQRYYSDDSPYLASVFLQKANLFRAQAKFADSYAYAEKALQIRTAKYGSNHSLTVECMQLVGRLKLLQGYPKEAMELFQSTLTTRKTCFESIYANHPLIIESTYYLGVCQSYLSMYDEAFSSFEYSLKMCDELKHECEVETFFLLEFSRMRIGEIHFTKHNFNESKTIVSLSGKALSEMTAGQHVAVADGLIVFGRIRRAEGKYTDVETVFERALLMKTNILGENHPDIAEIHLELAETARMYGNFQQAEKHASVCLGICSKHFPTESPIVGNAVFHHAQILRDSGNASAALQFYEESLAIYSKNIGDETAEYGYILGNYGECLRLAGGNNEKSGKATTEALTIIQKIFGKENVNNAEFMRNFALLNMDSREQDKLGMSYTILMDSVLPVSKNILGDKHPSTLYTKGLIGLVENLLMTPRTDRSGAAETETPSPQDMIDDALDYFDVYPHGKFSEKHPWVIQLGGFLTHETEHNNFLEGGSVSTIGSVGF